MSPDCQKITIIEKSKFFDAKIVLADERPHPYVGTTYHTKSAVFSFFLPTTKGQSSQRSRGTTTSQELAYCNMPTHPNVNPFYIEPASRAAWEEDIDGPIDEVELEGELLLPQRQTPRPDYRNPRRRRRGHASPRANRHLLCIFATILIVLLLLLSSRSSNKDSTASSQEPSSHHDGGTIPHIQQTTHPTTRISTNAPSTAPKVVVTPAPSVPVVDTEMPTVPQTPEETGAPTTDAPVTLTPTVQPTPNTLPPTLPPHNTPISTAQPTTVSSETTTPTLASGNPPATTVLPTPPPHDTLTPSTQPTVRTPRVL